jgi:hypothetical protein
VATETGDWQQVAYRKKEVAARGGLVVWGPLLLVRALGGGGGKMASRGGEALGRGGEHSGGG